MTVNLFNINGLCGKLSNSFLSVFGEIVSGCRAVFMMLLLILVQSSISSKSFNVLHISGPHSSHRMKAELPCLLMNDVAPLMYLLFCSCSWSKAILENYLTSNKVEQNQWA